MMEKRDQVYTDFFDEEKVGNITVGHPLISMWMYPRETIEEVPLKKTSPMIYMLIYLPGLSVSLNFAFNFGTGDGVAFSHVIIKVLLQAIIMGIGVWFLYSLFIFWIGKLFKGQASWKETSHAFAWGQVPLLGPLLISWPLHFYLFREELFTSNQVYLDSQQMMLYYTATGVDVIFSLWYIIVLSQAIGASHKFSSWKGFVTFLLSVLFIVAISIGIIYLLSYFV